MSVTTFCSKLVIVNMLFLVGACTSQTGIASINDSPIAQTRELTLQNGSLIVVAEGASEPRSIGSFSVRLYSPVNIKSPYDRFVVGVVSARDGSVEKIILADLNQNGDKELVVVTRSAGSGSYLSAYAFFIIDKRIVPALSEQGMKPGSDVIGALKAAFKTTQ